MENKKYFVWLSSLGIGEKRLQELLKRFGKLENIWEAREERFNASKWNWRRTFR